MARIPAFSVGDETTYLVALENGVTSKGTNNPPGSPAANETYIIGTSPTGAWAGNENKVASYIGGSWVFLPASGAIGTSQRGLRLGGAASNVFYLFDGTNWSSYAAPTRLVDHQNTIDPLPQYLMRYEGGSSPGAVSWGDIGGTLTAQTDLQAALDGKQASGSYANSNGTNFAIENRTSDPGSPATGQIWLRTDL
jgi:hypothetical protein